MKQTSGKKPEQLIEELKTSLANKKEKVAQVFFKFDKDNDSFLNPSEFTNFVKSYLPTITADETQTLLNFYNPYQSAQQLISLFQLVTSIQDDPNLLNHTKLQPLNKVFQTYDGNAQPIDVSQPQPSQQSSSAQAPQPVASLANQLDERYYIIPDPSIPGLKEFVILFDQLSKSKEKFVDKDFPASNQSLGPKEIEKKLIWLRPEEFWGDYHLFVKDEETGQTISPEDIVQGDLGDCYFLSSISAVANSDPHYIEELFVTIRENPYGIYCVIMCINGEYKAIVIDDQFPCRPKNKHPAFCSSKTKELWPMVMEKAWAKVFKSYDNIIAGNPQEVLRAMTGGVTWKVKTDDKEFENKLTEGYKKKCIMTSGTIPKPEVEKFGFVKGHAYAVLKTYDDPEVVNKKTKKPVKLIKIRNPWGEKEWNGDWSDGSDLWNEDLKKKYKLKNRNDGVFYMDILDFKKFFGDVEFGYYEDSYRYESVRAKFKKNHACYFQLDVQKKGQYFFTACQEDARFFKDQKDYSYSPVRILLAKYDKDIDRYEWIAAKAGNEREVYIEAELKNRKYILYVKAEWQKWQEREMVISAYGETPIKLKPTAKVPNVINNYYLDVSRANANWKPYQQQPEVRKCFEVRPEEGFGYMCFENKSNKTLETTVTFNTFTGLKFRKPERGNQFTAKVPPGQTKVVIAKVDPDGYTMKMSEAMKFT